MKTKSLFILCFVIFFINSSCGLSKELKILGFAHEGEVVIIKTGVDTLLTFKIEGTADTNRICFFSRKVNIGFKRDQLNLSVIIDSSSVNVLDTSLNFSKNEKEPFISLLNPHETSGKRRELFTGDKKDNY